MLNPPLLTDQKYQEFLGSIKPGQLVCLQESEGDRYRYSYCQIGAGSGSAWIGHLLILGGATTLINKQTGRLIPSQRSCIVPFIPEAKHKDVFLSYAIYERGDRHDQ